MPRNFLQLILVGVGLWVGCCHPGVAQTALESKYIRNSNSNKVIVFVHGFRENSVDTWTYQNSYWPQMIVADHYFDGIDVFVYQYDTSINARLTPDELADHMRVVLKSHGVSDRRQLIFLSHSMGGVVTRAYLLNNHDVASRTVLLQFFSTPTDGSSLASVFAWLNRAQIGKLSMNSGDDYLEDQASHWAAAHFDIPSFCAYEKQKTDLFFDVVTFQSATALCNRNFDGVDADHSSIVKPKDSESSSYLIFKANFMEVFGHPARELPSDTPAALIGNSVGGEIGSLSFTGNTVIGSPTVLNNAGSVGQALIDNNYIYGPGTKGAAEIINNSGRVDKASVSSNNIHLEDGSSEDSNQRQSTAETPPSAAPYFAGNTGRFMRTRGENTDLYVVENDVIGNVTFLDNSGSLDGTSISGNHINSTNRPGAPQIFNNSGQADHMYIANNGVQQAVTVYKSDSSGGSETIPSDLLNGHRVQNRNGTFDSAISLSPTVPLKPDYIIVALKGKNFLGVYFDSDPRIGKFRQVPIAGYTIVKLIRPSVPLKIVVFQSQPDCLCEGIISWGMSNTAQAR